MMKRLVLAGFFVVLSARAKTEANEPIKVLAYDALTGKGSLGELIEKEFPKSCKGCDIKIVSTKGLASLPGKLRANRRRGIESSVDIALGLTRIDYTLLKDEGLVSEGYAFDWSPFAFIVDTKRFPESEWPKSWSELLPKLEKQVLVQDPRLSNVGRGFLYSIVASPAVQESGKKIVKRVFPGWSASYEAFLSGEGKAVFSYQTSEAYHRCNEKTDKARYRALPLKEGYAIEQEFVAPVVRKKGKLNPNVQAFISFMKSELVQKSIAELNWMYPTEKVALPECYGQVTAVESHEMDPSLFKKTLKSAESWSL